MSRLFLAVFSLIFCLNYSQTKNSVKKSPAKKAVAKPSPKNLVLEKINDSVPALIPFKKDGKYGFRDQKGKVIITPEYSNVGFFATDCNLQNSKTEKVKKFGDENYASVRTLDGKDFRIDFTGKKVYTYKESDLGKCPTEFKKQLYHGYMKSGFYGIISDENFKNEQDYRDYQIFPQYQYVHILEGKDLKNPMIIAAFNDRFGVVDIHNKVVIPFEYAAIKPNFSWYLANLFEVSKDGKDYYFVDQKNRAY